MVDRIEIDATAEVTWGYLVKTWATGTSYVPDPDDKKKKIPVSRLPVPRTLDDLKDQLKLCGIDKLVKIPAAVKGFAVVQYSPQTLALRLPPKAMIEASEARLAKKGAYPARPFMDRMYADPSRKALSTEEKMEIHAARIGDYTITSCI